MAKPTDKPIPAALMVQKIRASGLNQAEFAKEIHASPQDITNWKKRGIPSAQLPAVCNALGMTTDEYLIAVGRLPKRKRTDVATSNVVPGPEIRGKVPLISWATAGHWAEVSDLLQPGEGEDWVTTTANVGPNAFALRVVGDSMEPKIPDGAIVIIDPSRQPNKGSIVLAKRTQDQEATLKQLWYDGATPMLRPLNPRYPIMSMPDDTEIIGVAIRIELDL